MENLILMNFFHLFSFIFIILYEVILDTQNLYYIMKIKNEIEVKSELTV